VLVYVRLQDLILPFWFPKGTRVISSKFIDKLAMLLQKINHPTINLLESEFLFLILAHPEYKIWIIHEPNKLELWDKLHFEEIKT